MDVTTARAEMESWLRALAAPMAPAPAANARAVELAMRPGNAGAPTAADPATPLARRETPAAGGTDPATLLARCETPAAGGTDPANSGEAPAERLPLGRDRNAQREQVLGAVAGRSSPPQVPTAPAASAGSDRSVDHEVRSADSDKAPAQPHDQRAAGAIPRSGRPTGPSGGEWWPAGPDPVAAAVDAALAPLLPPPAVPVESGTPDAASPDTVDGLRAYEGHDLTDLADLADLLAGVLEDETRALGVLELEP